MAHLPEEHEHASFQPADGFVNLDLGRAAASAATAGYEALRSSTTSSGMASASQLAYALSASRMWRMSRDRWPHAEACGLHEDGTLRASDPLVDTLHPVVETPSPGIYSVRYEWPDQLEPQCQQALVEAARAGSAHGPVGLLFILAPRICELSPTVRVFWRSVVSNPRLHVSAIAVVTCSWAIEVEALGFEVTNALSGRPLRVGTFETEAPALAWMVRAVHPDVPAQRRG
jgi:hypothetical protein